MARAYLEVTTWTLSPGAGVKCLGVWVADQGWYCTTLSEHSLAFTNLLPGGTARADGQRNQYHFQLARGDLVLCNLVAYRGDPDL